eukprot:gene6937-14088_t
MTANIKNDYFATYIFYFSPDESFERVFYQLVRHRTNDTIKCLLCGVSMGIIQFRDSKKRQSVLQFIMSMCKTPEDVRVAGFIYYPKSDSRYISISKITETILDGPHLIREGDSLPKDRCLKNVSHAENTNNIQPSIKPSEVGPFISQANIAMSAPVPRKISAQTLPNSDSQQDLWEKYKISVNRYNSFLAAIKVSKLTLNDIEKTILEYESNIQQYIKFQFQNTSENDSNKEINIQNLIHYTEMYKIQKEEASRIKLTISHLEELSEFQSQQSRDFFSNVTQFPSMTFSDSFEFPNIGNSNIDSSSSSSINKNISGNLLKLNDSTIPVTATNNSNNKSQNDNNNNNINCNSIYNTMDNLISMAAITSTSTSTSTSINGCGGGGGLFIIDRERLETLKLQWKNPSMSSLDAAWNTYYDILILYSEMYGHCNAPQSLMCQLPSGEVLRPGGWISKQRQLYARSKLATWRVHKLQHLVDAGLLYWTLSTSGKPKALGSNSSSNSTSGAIDEIQSKSEYWDFMYAALVKYGEEHNGDCLVPYNFSFFNEKGGGGGVDDEHFLGKWVISQKFKKNLNQLLPDQLIKLQGLVDQGKFSWGQSFTSNDSIGDLYLQSMHKNRATAIATDGQQYIQTGNSGVHTGIDIAARNTGRYIYRTDDSIDDFNGDEDDNDDHDDDGDESNSPSDVQLLLDRSSESDKRWLEGFHILLEYAEGHEGSCNVPEDYTYTREDGSTFKLGPWLKIQLNAQRRDILTPIQLHKLKGLVDNGNLSWRMNINNSIDNDAGTGYSIGEMRKRNRPANDVFEIDNGNGNSNGVPADTVCNPASKKRVNNNFEIEDDTFDEPDNAQYGRNDNADFSTEDEDE